MKRILPAFILFFIGVIQIGDWLLFTLRSENEYMTTVDLNAKYAARFPSFLQFYFTNPIISTLTCMIFLGTAGVLFIREEKKIFLVLGVVSFVLAFWQLFALL
jgi:hypothetical protein